jgi:hypothetical protein
MHAGQGSWAVMAVVEAGAEDLELVTGGEPDATAHFIAFLFAE